MLRGGQNNSVYKVKVQVTPRIYNKEKNTWKGKQINEDDCVRNNTKMAAEKQINTTDRTNDKK